MQDRESKEFRKSHLSDTDNTHRSTLEIPDRKEKEEHTKSSEVQTKQNKTKIFEAYTMLQKW